MIDSEDANIGKNLISKTKTLFEAYMWNTRMLTTECKGLSERKIYNYHFSNKKLLYYEGHSLFLEGDCSGSRRQVAWRDKKAFPIFH